MAKGLVAKQAIKIDAPASKVWDALVNPEKVKQYMFGATVASDWKPGSAITFTGEWKGKAYQDKGVIVRAEPRRILEYTHFSPLSGLPDTPDNYHTVTIELSEQNQATTLALSQDNNPNEQARQHSEKNWGVMLANLKKVVEQT
ncbi:MAG TPA: SRPBCC domain-containing protein [bacterium]|nr:SRPBCC domain-containing protein [bacterium]